MFLNISYITKVNFASLNGTQGSGGNLVEIKKITDYNGNEFAYVSGQALRRYLKETLFQLGDEISGVGEKGESTIKYKGKIESINTSKFDEDLQKAIFENVCDLDLFGYMIAEKKVNKRRWSPIKVSPMISMLPFKGETDLLVRKHNNEKGLSADFVQIEIDTLNFMRGSYMINEKHIGHLVDEYTYERKQILEDEKIKNRYKNLLDSIKMLNGGAKQARNLEDISPKFIILVKQKTANPFLLNTLSIDRNGNLNIENIKQALEDNESESYKIGLSNGIFNNEEEIKKYLKPLSIKDAINFYKEIFLKETKL